MGFGFRKSFGSGPFRFTVSPRGVSSSFGIKGARISAGPRGTFVTVSSHGVYYRHRIDSPASPLQQDYAPKNAYEQPQLDSVFQVPVSELVASNQSELVMTLNENVSAINPAFVPYAISCLALFLVPSYPLTAFIVVFAGIILGTLVFRSFREAHTHEIHYSLDATATARFAAIQKSLFSLASCCRVWVLNTSSSTSDLKRNAGASTLITRKPASVGVLPTKGFRTSVPISSVEANGTLFHFLPDQILLFCGNRYASIQYEQLVIGLTATRFVETEPAPRDSRQVDTTWRYVNKSGGPDRRFNNNVQIPILQYGEVTLRTNTGIQVILQTSSLEKAQEFAAQFSPKISGGRSEPHSSESRAKPPARETAQPFKYYALLGLTRPATLDQAAAAHRQKASLYHPDKYEHLAPEMKALASARMAEINEAYMHVKKDIIG